jgi:hypothetical protein
MSDLVRPPGQTLDLRTSSFVTRLSRPDPRALHIRAVRVQLRRLTLKPCTTPLELSPLGFTERIPLQSGGLEPSAYGA